MKKKQSITLKPDVSVLTVYSNMQFKNNNKDVSKPCFVTSSGRRDLSGKAMNLRGSVLKKLS